MEVRDATSTVYRVEPEAARADNDVRSGYKRAEVGVIPNNWDVVAAGSLGKFRGGNGFPLAYQGKIAGDYPFFKVSDMNNKGNEIEMLVANNYISDAMRKQLGAHAFPATTIIFAKVGAAVFLERKKLLAIPSCIDNNMMGFTITDEGCAFQYVLYYFLSFSLGSLVSTTALPSLSGDVLNRIQIPMPPTLAEQQAIAEALSDADALIESLQQLIAKQRALKQGTMQALLTGRQRLPGFTGEWKTVHLGEMGAFRKGRGIPRSAANTGGLPAVRYGEIYTIHSNYVRSFATWISEQVAASAVRITRGDILFAGSGETKEEIGKCIAITQHVVAYAGGDVVIFRPHEGDPLYYGYALNMPEVNQQKASRGQGDAVVHISTDALGQLEISVPSVQEQTAIATVLSDMDAEIEALEARLAKTRALKTGMMQQLLTGRIRLV